MLRDLCMALFLTPLLVLAAAGMLFLLVEGPRAPLLCLWAALGTYLFLTRR